MEQKRPVILVSNDDGVTAKGINELIKFLRPFGDIVVMAPDSPRSGNGSALTVTQPVHYQQVSTEPGLTIYSCTGTPTDCIKLARNTVLEKEPDLVITGINHGDNSGTNVHYSGTMGAAIEGCLNGIPSIGFSLCNHDCEADFTYCEPIVKEITAMVIKEGLPAGVCLNVNIPLVPDIKGIRVCQQAMGRWTREWERCPRKWDANYFWLTGEFVAAEPQHPDSDNLALSQGYAAVTPISVDLTAYSFLEELKKKLS